MRLLNYQHSERYNQWKQPANNTKYNYKSGRWSLCFWKNNEQVLLYWVEEKPQWSNIENTV